jgi:phospholipid-binding lipoprotein MlaA
MNQSFRTLLLATVVVLTTGCAQLSSQQQSQQQAHEDATAVTNATIDNEADNQTVNESPKIAVTPAEDAGGDIASANDNLYEPIVDDRDPLEGLNRELWDFNWLVLDKYVLRPLAVGYSSLPQPMQTGVRGVVTNLEEPGYAINNLLQGKLKRSGISAGRFIVNSTIGILGIFDVAKKMGMEKQKEDFGQTLGVAGVGNGAFLMLPGYGPTTLRDGFGDFVDGQIFPLYLIEWPWNLVKTGVKAVYTRADLIQQEKLINDSFDSYIFVKEAYFQNQRYELFDGNPPVKQQEFEFDEAMLDEID